MLFSEIVILPPSKEASNTRCPFLAFPLWPGGRITKRATFFTSPAFSPSLLLLSGRRKNNYVDQTEHFTNIHKKILFFNYEVFFLKLLIYNRYKKIKFTNSLITISSYQTDLKRRRNKFIFLFAIFRNILCLKKGMEELWMSRAMEGEHQLVYGIKLNPFKVLLEYHLYTNKETKYDPLTP